ncbi:beta strand repeat-containing protein [Caldimonas sp. KR1-144]|uniref:beta strand repeat-containing protein n=1 Tax=Caldimonas sp. KR1-144 TaxID=3400911 RepID=UPI003C074778
MNKWLMRWLALLASAALLVACGGGAGSGDPLPGTDDGGGDGDSTAAVIEVLASSNSVGTGGDTITLTAIVKDSSNAAVADTVLSFSTNTGTLSGVSATTDDNGVATATFGSGSDKSNRTATITVTSGSATGSIEIPVEGTKLTYSGATTLTLGASQSMTVTATDSKGNGISGAVVTVASSLGNGLSASSVTTDALGQASLTYTGTNSGTDAVDFAGVGATSTQSIVVSGEDFAFVSPAANTQVAVGASQTVSVRYRQGGVAQAGRTINFASTIGTLSASSAVTNASGVASVSISSTFAGSASLTASLQGGTAQATLPISFVATTPNALVLQVTPTAIGPNAGGSTTNQATVLAKVTDAAANPVAGVTVNFSQLQDASGGSLSQASAVTDITGQASVKYISGASSTASNGVKLHAVVASVPSVTGDASLTVSQSALFIALGTGNTITNIDPQTYQKDYVVYVTDANGVAVSGVTITAKALPQRYMTGSLTFVDPSWTYSLNVRICDSEDRFYGETDARSYNGVLDSGEDANSNGSLEPGNVISISPGNVTTDSNGRATLSLIYAESYAPWVELKLQVEAIVSGTASSTSSTFVVRGSSSDFSDETVPPAGVVSPFGVSSSCPLL